jgi:hypothetical protein
MRRRDGVPLSSREFLDDCDGIPFRYAVYRASLGMRGIDTPLSRPDRPMEVLLLLGHLQEALRGCGGCVVASRLRPDGLAMVISVLRGLREGL